MEAHSTCVTEILDARKENRCTAHTMLFVSLDTVSHFYQVGEVLYEYRQLARQVLRC